MSSRASLEFGPLTSIVGFRLRAAQLAMYEDFLGEAPVSGLTPGQFAILLLVEHNPGLTQQLLSDGMGVEKSTLVVRLHRLEERGLTRRVRSSNDRRSNVVEVTALGRKCLRRMLTFVRRHEDRVLASLSAPERVLLLKLLGKVMRVGRVGPRASSSKRRAPAPARKPQGKPASVARVDSKGVTRKPRKRRASRKTTA